MTAPLTLGDHYGVGSPPLEGRKRAATRVRSAKLCIDGFSIKGIKREPVLGRTGLSIPDQQYRDASSQSPGVAAIAEISTNAPFFGRAATWIVARDGGAFLKKVA